MLKPQLLPHSWEHIFRQPRQNTSKEIAILLSGQTSHGQTEAHNNVPYNSTPNADAEADLLHMFPEVTVLDGKHTLKPVHRILCKKNSSSVC